MMNEYIMWTIVCCVMCYTFYIAFHDQTKRDLAHKEPGLKLFVSYIKISRYAKYTEFVPGVNATPSPVTTIT